MNNLARIVSHGFAIVVVLLLGIGFIYRGELFPDLELPDFLVPESERVAGAGDTQGNVKGDMAPTQETAPGEPVGTASTAPVDESVAAVPAAPAVEATAGASKAGVESQQPVAGIAPPPAAEEPMPGERVTASRGEASGATGTEVVPVPVPSSETPAGPKAGVAGPGPGAEPASAGADTVSEPEASGSDGAANRDASSHRHARTIPRRTAPSRIRYEHGGSSRRFNRWSAGYRYDR